MGLLFLTGTIINISSQFAARRPIFRAICRWNWNDWTCLVFNNKFVKNYVRKDEVSVYGKVRRTMGISDDKS